MMDTFEMDDFSLLVDDWSLGQPFDFNQYDDFKVTGVIDDRDFTVIKTEAQIDLLNSILDSPNDQHSDPFGAEWMENADLLQLLDVGANHNEDVVEQVAVPEVDLYPIVSPLVAEPVVLGVKREKHTNNDGYEFLQNLLKQSELDMQGDAAPVSSPISSPTSPEAQVAPEIDCVVLEEMTDASIDLKNAEFLGSPLSVDDVESLLSATSPSPSTIDSSSLYDESTTSSSITCHSSDLYQLVANVTKGQKSRGSPYSRSQDGAKATKSKGRKQTATISPNPSELELELMSKKDRKKLQNKNAAIRYRQKKKEETDVVKTELDELEDVNEGLQEKVEQLQREVQYMKNLIRDVQKARGLKTFSV